MGTTKTSQTTPATQPQYTNYWALLTRKRHILPHPAQPQHTNHWALRTRKPHQQEHRPQRPTESSDPTQHAEGRTGDCPGPRKGATTRRNVTQGDLGGSLGGPHIQSCFLLSQILGQHFFGVGGWVDVWRLRTPPPSINGPCCRSTCRSAGAKQRESTSSSWQPTAPTQALWSCRRDLDSRRAGQFFSGVGLG